MKYQTTEKQLVITVNEAEQSDLQELKTTCEWGSMALENEYLESLIANSELDWIDASETGDLTDAPILGIRDEEGNILARWGYMNYQIHTFLEDFLNNGKAIFVSSN